MEELSQTQTHNHILVVDDQPGNLRVLNELLSKNGYEVHSIRDSRSVEYALETLTPDLFLLDINMPHLNGFELAHMLQNNPQTADIPIIFISASDAEADIRRGFELGAVDYITKPIRTFEVLARVGTHLRLRCQQIALADKVAEVEDLRQQEQERFISLKEMQNHFLQTATHDLKNPLYTIVGYMDLIDDMGEDLTPEQMTTFTKHIAYSTDKMRRLITDMLDLLHAESQQLRLDLRLVELAEYLHTELEPYKMRADEKQITIELHHPDENVYIMIDPILFSRVIDNIVSNAIKYSPDETTINICYVNIQHGVVIEVEDQGFGMSEETLEGLFVPFYRAPNIDKSNIEGTGLGMAITKEIVEQHGGVIDVQSDVGVGTIFRIIVPNQEMKDVV